MSASLRLIQGLRHGTKVRLSNLAGSAKLPFITTLPTSRFYGRWCLLGKVNTAKSIANVGCLSTSSHRTAVQSQDKSNATTVEAEKHDFQAETRMLLDIVARSLYSENEVFIRELVSNASDALEKFRYQLHTGGDGTFADIDRPMEISIQTDKQAQTLTIQDSGIGMNREELISNLGTIARSGSKKFLEEISGSGMENSSNIIGQFGVGFYSAFMVAERLEVFTRSAKVGAPGLRWASVGSGTYEIEDAVDVAIGTKIVIHLKTECREFADEEKVKGIIKKYSNFVGSPIKLNGVKVNDIQPLWLLEPKAVGVDEHIEFYRFISNSYDSPRFTLHYKTDVPLSIRALLYFPEGKPGMFELSRNIETGVALYTRKILIQSKTDQLLPKWLRFIKGVVDSEDIPLNLSRELLQNSSLIRKLRNVLTARVIRFLLDRSAKEPDQYDQFYTEYGLFLKEGIVTSEEQTEKEDIAKLLRFDSSRCTDTKRISLTEYCSNMKADQKDLYYIAAPSRTLAENSPYYEGLKKKDVEVLFCYEPYDELVLMQLQQYSGKQITSVEKEMRLDREADNLSELGADCLQRMDIFDLLPWIKQQLDGKVANVKATARLEEHPCVVTVEDMGAARHFIRTQGHQIAEENRYALLQPQMEINPKHQLIRKMFELKKSNPKLASLLAKQLFANAMVGAGLSDDPRMLLTTINELLEKALEKN